jgi:hypothetical protein
MPSFILLEREIKSFTCPSIKPGKGIVGNGANLNVDFTLGV